MSNPDSKSSSSTKPQSKEPALKFTFEEFREMKNLEAAGDIIAIQNLKKKVRRRMELELSSGKFQLMFKCSIVTLIEIAKHSRSYNVNNNFYWR